MVSILSFVQTKASIHKKGQPYAWKAEHPAHDSVHTWEKDPKVTSTEFTHLWTGGKSCHRLMLPAPRPCFSLLFRGDRRDGGVS